MESKSEEYNDAFVVVGGYEKEVAKGNEGLVINIVKEDKVELFLGEPEKAGEILVRVAAKKDLGQILELVDEQLDGLYLEPVKQEVEDISTGKAEGFVAESSSKIVGYACWRVRFGVAYLETIVVKQGAQGKGIGSILLNEVISSIKARCHEIRILNVITDSDAKDAVSFYIKKGFVVSGTVNDEFIPGVNQVHLSLRLDR